MPLHENWQEMSKIISKAIAQAWLDDAFRTKLLEDPKTTLEKMGVFFPKGVTVQADQGTSTWKAEPTLALSENAVITVPVPPRPADVDVEDLKRWINEGTDPRPCCLPNSS